jgi:hypothetical protein
LPAVKKKHIKSSLKGKKKNEYRLDTFSQLLALGYCRLSREKFPKGKKEEKRIELL